MYIIEYTIFQQKKFTFIQYHNKNEFNTVYKIFLYIDIFNAKHYFKQNIRYLYYFLYWTFKLYKRINLIRCVFRRFIAQQLKELINLNHKRIKCILQKKCL
jgi:hypothetical protein